VGRVELQGTPVLPFLEPLHRSFGSHRSASFFVSLKPEQSKVVFVLELIAEEVALAQVSLVGKAKLEQQAFGALIGHIDDRLHAMQPQKVKSIAQDGRQRFGRYALSPTSALEFVARFGARKVN
jgi:hypothetical protein